MNEANVIHIDGVAMTFEPGETIHRVATRHEKFIPTLCHDPRLEPTAACRICLVEVEGERRLLPACATPARPGMRVATAAGSERVARHLRALLQLYLTDHPAPEDGEDVPDRIHAFAEHFGVEATWPTMSLLRQGRDDPNPYILFRPERCIVCGACTRYCEEVEGVSAITLAGRGANTTISTAESIGLLESTCEFCGGCIAVCPTGAMTEKMPLLAGAPPERELEKVRTTCNYCGVGCQFDLNIDRKAEGGRGRVVKITPPPPETTTNDGNLCIKGRFAYDFIHSPDRLTTPLVRGEDGRLHEASWEEALDRVVEGLAGVKERHGSDALGFISSSRATGEENYLMQKLARAVFGTNNVHQCAAT